MALTVDLAILQAVPLLAGTRSRNRGDVCRGRAVAREGSGEKGKKRRRSSMLPSPKRTGGLRGWPANHGIWSWKDEILVGFSRGTYKDRGRYHHIDHDKPEEHLRRGSLDGGLTWSVEKPNPQARWRIPRACAMARCRLACRRSTRSTFASRSTSLIPTSP